MTSKIHLAALSFSGYSGLPSTARTIMPIIILPLSYPYLNISTPNHQKQVAGTNRRRRGQLLDSPQITRLSKKHVLHKWGRRGSYGLKNTAVVQVTSTRM